MCQRHYQSSRHEFGMTKCPFFKSDCLMGGCELWVVRDDLEQSALATKGRKQRIAGNGMCAIKFNAIVYG